MRRLTSPADRCESTDLHPHSRFDEAPVRAVPVLTPPSIDLIAATDDDELDYADRGDPSVLWEAFSDALGLRNGFDQPAHQFFGEPVAPQMDPLGLGGVKLGMDVDIMGDLEGRDQVRLLAQFTSDPELNIEIADAGVIHIVIGLEDLQADRYDRVSVHLDSH